MRIEIDFPPEFARDVAEQVADMLAERGLLTAPARGPYLDVDGAARYLACSKQRIYDLVSSDAIEPQRDGRRLLFSTAALDAYVNASRAAAVRIAQDEVFRGFKGATPFMPPVDDARIELGPMPPLEFSEGDPATPFTPLERSDDPYLKGEGGNCGITRVPDGIACPLCWRRHGEWHQPHCPNDNWDWPTEQNVKAPPEQSRGTGRRGGISAC